MSRDHFLPPHGRRREIRGQRGAATTAAADRHRRRRRVCRPGGRRRRVDPRFGRTKRIISVHDFRKTPDNLEEIHRRLCGLDPDIIKICTMANHPHDNLRMLELARHSKVPTVGLCMGDIGIPTRILAGKFGAPFTYATFHHERVLAPGQLSFQQMTETYHYDQINAETEVYGVVADPVGHSLSPLIHNVAFRHFKLNKVYIPIRVPREDLARFIDDAGRLDIRGLSVTIPHKEEVVKKLTEADGAVRGIGAAKHRHFRREKTARLQHRLQSGHGQPGSRHRRRPRKSNERVRARRRWCSAPAEWARPWSTG